MQSFVLEEKMPNKNKQLIVYPVILGVFIVFALGLASAQVPYENLPVGVVTTQSSANSQNVQAATSANRVAEFDRDQLLRCWQRGHLITTEGGWKPAQTLNETKKFVKGNRELLLLEFGETFCIYNGG